jgi:hypothetical protein
MKRIALCTLAVLALGFGQALSATLTVDAAGGADYTTIQAAVTAAADGDVIQVADGTYTVSSQLNITKGLTLSGASEAGTIVDCSASAGYGFSIAASNVTVENMTILPPDQNYTIHASGTSNPPNGFDNLVLRHVSITGSHRRTAFDVHGYNTVTLSHLTSADAYGGNGLQVTGCVDVTMDNITTANNAWGSIAIYCSSSSYLNRGSSNVQIDGTTLSVGEDYVFSQDEFGLFNTNYAVSGYGHHVRNSRFREPGTDSEGYTFLRNDLAHAAALALALPFPEASTIIDLDTGNYAVAAGMSIQAAIDAADAGGVINVGAGHFEEQLHITLNDLVIAGAGKALTFIDSPVDLPLGYSSGSSTNYPIVYVENCGGVAISGLTVDGLGRGNANYRFQGIGFWNSGGSVADVDVMNISDTPFSGAQHCVGVYAYNNTGGPYAISLTDVLVDDYQKNGVALSGEGLTVALTRVTTIGAGPTDVTAQNGIQISYGAGGTMDECSISGCFWDGPTWWASGLLVYQSPGIAITNTNIDGCQGSYYLYDVSGSVTGGSVTNALAAGVGIYNSAAKAAATHRQAQPLADDYVAAPNKAATTFVVDGVSATGNGAAGTWGLDLWAEAPLDITCTNSSFDNFDYGMSFAVGAGSITGYATGNAVANSGSFGAWTNNALPIDARDNDWGDASGPLHATNPGGLGDAVSDNILFTPWTGRTTSVVADLGATPSGAFYWEGTPAVGVDDDAAPGFEPGAFQAPAAYTRYGFAPEALFGRPVTMGELYDIRYLTKKDTTHDVDAADWYLVMYTDPYDGSPGSSWYGNRINAEPYFSDDLNETAGEWTAWQSLAGVDNRLRFFDSSSGYFGSYTDGFLEDMAADAAYAAQPLMLFGVSLGTAWAAGFDGLLDGLEIELVSGEILTLNFLSGNAAASAATDAVGPLACGDELTFTFSLDLSADMPDVFLYNAVVRASAELSFGTITDLLPFTDVNNNFFTFDNGDGSYTITGSTVANPSSPISGPGTFDLFSIGFAAAAEGSGAVSFDSLVLRDPENNTIASITDGASIAIDCTAPAAVTGIAAAPGHNKIDVSWNHDGGDVDHYEVFAGLWHDGAGASAYPEYDDLPGDVIPARPADYAAAAASGEWVSVGVPGSPGFTQNWADHLARGVYYYEVFAVDAAGNASPAAAANDRATNYWLGDVYGPAGDATPNGLVDPFDINELGSYFFTTVNIGDAGAAVDVGPTDDWSRLGIPTTDSRVDFEDLMVFSMNFGVVAPAKTMPSFSDRVVLAWADYGNGRYGLRLVEGDGLKGLRITGPGNVISVEAGQLLDEQSEPTFVRNDGESFHAVAAVMGTNVAFQGAGDLLIVEAGAAMDASDLVISARGVDNSELTVSLEQTSGALTPRVFSLYPNYPNPFNPMTKISFSLPEAQAVRLSIYSVDGRRVATLMQETRPAGLHEVIWKGQDNNGRQMASGVYFCRIEAGPYSAVHKMTLTK